MKLQRGFKAYANAFAVSFRSELGLSTIDVFDPREAAVYLDIPVLAFEDLAGCNQHAVAVLRKAGAAVSGFTIFRGQQRMIVFNDAHSPGRINNTLAHEIAHALLGHKPGQAIGLHGCRSVTREWELEADTLSGALLLPEPVCLHCARLTLSADDIAELYKVSRELATYRMNITGARKRVARQQRSIATQKLRRSL